MLLELKRVTTTGKKIKLIGTILEVMLLICLECFLFLFFGTNGRHLCFGWCFSIAYFLILYDRLITQNKKKAWKDSASQRLLFFIAIDYLCYLVEIILIEWCIPVQLIFHICMLVYILVVTISTRNDYLPFKLIKYKGAPRIGLVLPIILTTIVLVLLFLYADKHSASESFMLILLLVYFLGNFLPLKIHKYGLDSKIKTIVLYIYALVMLLYVGVMLDEVPSADITYFSFFYTLNLPLLICWFKSKEKAKIKVKIID